MQLALKHTLAVSLITVAASLSSAAAKPHQVSISADVAITDAVIDKDIYGQFAEHLGRGIYEGLWVGESSNIPNTKGFRDDVIKALKQIKVPLVRWPGGCFADEYHWRDGIGDKSKRPIKVNTHWGGVEETNAVGTHEFFDLVELLGADAYINGNLGSGSVREMAEWVEYMTSDKNSTLANERRANGREAPWKIAYFGIGNESWGCGGHMSPDYYVDLYRRYATFLKTPPGLRPKLVASGGHTEDTQWTDILSKQLTRDVDGISYHFYTIPNSDWRKKGHATEFDHQDWFKTLERTLRIDTYLSDNLALLEQNDPGGDIAFYVDEWGTWYDPESEREPGFLYQQNTLRDGIVAAVNFNIFHRHAKRVKMTNIAQMVNVLQAMVLTDGPDMLLTPTYYAYDLYQVFQGAQSIPFTINSSRYQSADQSVPAVTASLAQGADGKVYVALVNLDPKQSANVTLALSNTTAKRLTGRLLTAKDITAKNTFKHKQNVIPTAFSARLDSLVLPAKSIIVAAVE